MSETKPLHLVIEDPIFHLPVHLCLNYTPEAFIKWEHKRFSLGADSTKTPDLDGLIGCAYTVCSSNRIPEFVVWIREFTWSIESQRTLIHELTHVVMRIWEYKHVKANIDTQEFLCCSIDGLYGQAARKLHKRRICNG